MPFFSKEIKPGGDSKVSIGPIATSADWVVLIYKAAGTAEKQLNKYKI